MFGVVSRRALLGGVGVALAAAGGGTYGLLPGAPAEGFRVLTPAEIRVLDAIADVFFPGVHFPISGSRAGCAAKVDAILDDVMEPLHANGFRYVLRALEWGTLASRGRYFTELDRVAQREVLETWAEPEVVPRRIAGESLKAVLGMAYFSHPDVQRAIGWRAGCGGAV